MTDPDTSKFWGTTENRRGNIRKMISGRYVVVINYSLKVWLGSRKRKESFLPGLPERMSFSDSLSRYRRSRHASMSSSSPSFYYFAFGIYLDCFRLVFRSIFFFLLVDRWNMGRWAIIRCWGGTKQEQWFFVRLIGHCLRRIDFIFFIFNVSSVKNGWLVK